MSCCGCETAKPTCKMQRQREMPTSGEVVLSVTDGNAFNGRKRSGVIDEQHQWWDFTVRQDANASTTMKKPQWCRLMAWSVRSDFQTSCAGGFSEGTVEIRSSILFYGSPSTHVREDEMGNSQDIPQGEGGEQGDPLMSFLFAFGLHRALTAVRERLGPSEKVFAFFDDVYVICSFHRVLQSTEFQRRIC